MNEQLLGYCKLNIEYQYITHFFSITLRRILQPQKKLTYFSFISPFPAFFLLPKINRLAIFSDPRCYLPPPQVPICFLFQLCVRDITLQSLYSSLYSLYKYCYNYYYCHYPGCELQASVTHNVVDL